MTHSPSRPLSGSAGVREAAILEDSGRVTTYGEVRPSSFVADMLPRLGLHRHPCPAFGDLGSGNGALVLLVGACVGAASLGVEVVGRRHSAAQCALALAQTVFPSLARSVKFLHGDARVQPLPPLSHVFMNNYVFDAALNSALLTRLASMPSVCVVSGAYHIFGLCPCVCRRSARLYGMCVCPGAALADCEPAAPLSTPQPTLVRGEARLRQAPLLRIHRSGPCLW